MGRALLMIAALALYGCNEQSREPVPADRGEPAATSVMAAAPAVDGHAGMSCAACHQGRKADFGRASVPRAACTASGCHEDAGPPEVTLANASFEHRNHGQDSEIALSCAGCHTHDGGTAPLRAAVDGCALCHERELDDTNTDACKTCHGKPTHVGLASQGIPVAHASLPWLETGCSRCHYDVRADRNKVGIEVCASCHARSSAVTRRGIGRDLHPAHGGVGCTSCHEAGLHRIGAMSSAVNLQCADCHDSAHGQKVVSGAATEVCSSCHANAHVAQQRLVLGFVGSEPVLPSAKFAMGLTCRSCHVPPGTAATGTGARRGQAAACAGCHEQEFARVLEWWLDGLRTRARAVGAYVATAQQQLATASDTSRALVTNAAALLALVREAGGQHNLELSDLLFRTSVTDVSDAYKLAGRAVPAAPQLGSTPHVGTCSFCHYGRSEALNYGTMRPGLHDRLTRTKRP
jgi:hypothetical protein